MKKNNHEQCRRAAAFSLIELLVVIAIISILAALVVGLSGVAITKSRLSRAATELEHVATVIETYKLKKGFYPPDNTNNPAVSPLYYELSGTVYDPNAQTFTVLKGDESISRVNVGAYFRLGGLVNSTQDPVENPVFSHQFKPEQYREIRTSPDIELLALPIEGPVNYATDVNLKFVNPWRYVSSNPTNNPNSFDLWIDIKIRGKTNRISNWSKGPQIVN